MIPHDIKVTALIYRFSEIKPKDYLCASVTQYQHDIKILMPVVKKLKQIKFIEAVTKELELQQ